VFECSRDEVTTPAGHRMLAELRIVCPEGHEYDGAAAERILHGERATPPPSYTILTPRAADSRATGGTPQA
jgi:hypothetical protein